MDILIEELDGGLWVAALDKGRLDGLEVDPGNEEVRWGSVYWAKVARIDSSLDAAFVNLDGDNIGILHNADVRIRNENGEWIKGGDTPISKLIEPGQMIAVQAKSGFLPKGDEEYSRAEDKNPKLSMNLALSGRYMLYTPMDANNRISRRIRDQKLRAQLTEMLKGMKGGHGCILRAASADTQTDILTREIKILHAMWEQLQEHFTGDDPSLIMLGPDAIQRTLSDHAARRIDRIELTTMDHFQYAEEWCDIFAPDLVTKIVPVEVPDPMRGFALFDFRDIIGQIEELFQPYAILPSGATLIIQQTAALLVIDVNSAADSRGKLAINIDAGREIARQLRLRNIGGAVVIDFLKMKNKAEQDQLLKALEDAFYSDPCTVQLHGVTNLGLVELTRHRRTPALQERFESIIEE